MKKKIKPKKKIVKKVKKKIVKKIHRSVIKKTMILSDVIFKYPKAREVFLNLGLMCAVCGFSDKETIEQAATIHGLDLKKLLRELNKAVK